MGHLFKMASKMASNEVLSTKDVYNYRELETTQLISITEQYEKQ